MKEINDLICFLPRLKVNQVDKLRENFENISDIKEITSDKINDVLGKKIFNKKEINDYVNLFEKIYEENEKISSYTVNIFDKDYPQKLKHIRDIPKLLFLKGNIKLFKSKFTIGVVGSRKPTVYGISITKSLVEDLAEYGFCIVSGMARGIDSISHKSALKGKTDTICVFGTPISKIYPAKNRALAKEVVDSGGLIVSEHQPFENTLPAFFAQRNRIISGLSDGLLITEAGDKSGTLITANYAIEQGKQVFAVPGNINSNNSHGTNRLIKDGACMVLTVSDILNEFNIDETNIKKIKDIDGLSEVENKVISIVKSQGSCHSEYISLKTNIKIDEVVAILNILSIKGYIEYDGFMANSKMI